jgi:ubiquinone/menaquinone biosynthesis C-methylase UbiE
MFRRALDEVLNLAPVESPVYVLDIGTGTGIWAVDFAKEHPSSNVIGTELTGVDTPSPVANCMFLAADAEADIWPFSHKFDYIHLRMTISCFSSQRDVFAKCFSNLNPGGWIELQDTHFAAVSDDGSTNGTAIESWCDGMVKGAAAIGRNLHDTANYKQFLAETGFEDIVEKKIPLPWSEWSDDLKLKELGRLQAMNSRQGGRGASAKILASAGLKPDEIQYLLRRVKTDLENPSIHAYAPLYVVYGRKPRA